MKKFVSLTLSLALAASLTVPAFAAETVTAVPISAPLTYGYEITVNGVKLDTAKLPMADENYIPMRAVAESDHGSAGWYAEENTGSFYMDSLNLTVSFADNSVTLGREKLDAAALVKNGVTFLPLSVFDGVEGYTVTVTDNKIDITTPNGAPLSVLGYAITEATGLEGIRRNESSQIESFFNLKAENYADAASFLPMMNVKAGGLFLGKVADGKLDAAKAELQAYLERLQKSFEQYLPDQYEIAMKGKVVVEGDYIMLTITQDNDKAVELFKAFVAEQK